MRLEFTLTCVENQWSCHNSVIQFTANSLDEIDEKIIEYYSKKYSKELLEVEMYFDFNAFPQWYRQYMTHYFNRKITFKLPEYQELN